MEKETNLPWWWNDYKKALVPSNDDKEDLPSLIKRIELTAEKRGARKCGFGLVDEYHDNLLDIAINNKSLRGCITTNQMNDHLKVFKASTHEATANITKDPTKEDLIDNKDSL